MGGPLQQITYCSFVVKMTTFCGYSLAGLFFFFFKNFQKVPIWLATKVCDYRAQVRIFFNNIC